MKSYKSWHLLPQKLSQSVPIAKFALNIFVPTLAVERCPHCEVLQPKLYTELLQSTLAAKYAKSFTKAVLASVGQPPFTPKDVKKPGAKDLWSCYTYISTNQIRAH